MTSPGTTDAADLDGHTIEQLSDYLDRGMVPSDPTIDSSPGCQIALRSLSRLHSIAAGVLEAEARAEPVRDDSWIERIISRIVLEARAGRTIPFHSPSGTARLAITEGAVRGIIRGAGDLMDGVLIGRCRLEGDVTVPGEPITVTVDVSVAWGESIPGMVERVRHAIREALTKHTELTVVGIDITVHDIQSADRPPRDSTRRDSTRRDSTHGDSTGGIE